jgi:putative transcriptional regulator
MGNSIYVPQNYGKILFSFSKVMDEKKINRNQLANRAGIRFEVADRFYNGSIERLDIDVLARVCFVLDCNVSDVMDFSQK